MRKVSSKINRLINELQLMSSQLADCDPDGDRILEEGLKPFLVSACIGMIEKMDLSRDDWILMMQYVLDHTDLGIAIPYDAGQIRVILDGGNSDAYNTLYGMANGWDLNNFNASWPIYITMALYFDEEDIALKFLPSVSDFLKLISHMIDTMFTGNAASQAYYSYMRSTVLHINEHVKRQFGINELFQPEILFENNQVIELDDFEMEETLDDWIMAKGENPYDIETRIEAIRDPFGFWK